MIDLRSDTVTLPSAEMRQACFDVRVGDETDGEESTRWFAAGLAQDEADGGLLHHLFGVRSRGLMGEVPAEGLRSYLSGLLIGHEVAAATKDPVDRVHLLGSARLGVRYTAALTRRGIAVTGT